MVNQFFKFGRHKPTPEAAGAPERAEIEVEGAGRVTVDQLATVGRGPECQVNLNFRSVSRNHARIFFEGGHYWIKDLESANGTSVNGKKIRLQMLSDGDNLCFGDVKAVFRCSFRSPGPAALAEDPLAGTDAPVPDGTPTGGLGDLALPAARGHSARPPETTMPIPEPGMPGRESQLQMLTRKVESLQAENERLRREISQMRSALRGTVSTSAQQTEGGGEIERLRRLVSQLERALADSNQRIRNLQERH
jgi:predicted component of type VI protein secretion system